jgi:hypothetical protein
MTESHCRITLDDFKIWETSYHVLHREDGPAMECPDGRKYWYIGGELLIPEEVIYDINYKETYPKLIESMIVYLVHNS